MLQYTTKSFEELSTNELYEIMVLRQEVFIVEQDCPYLDADGKDQKSYHVIGRDNKGLLHGYTRLVPKGISYDKYNSIGRVITSSAYRGKGEGKMLMQASIKSIKHIYPGQITKISAQVYAIPFYEKLGFESVGDHYMEDNIPHVAMLLD